jgi:Ni/Co efflux regulator RcnB
MVSVVSLKRRLTMLKKILLAVSAVAVSSAAFAHDGWERDRDGDRYRDQHRVERFHEERPRVVERRPVIVEPPRHVVYAPSVPVYPQPGITVTLPW